MPTPTEQLILIGTHDYFVHAVYFDTETRKLRKAEPHPTPQNPSWLEQHPTIPNLVYINSHAECKLFAFQVDQETAKLTQLAEASSGGQLPAHYALHPTAGVVFTHYGSGQVTRLALDDKGLFVRDAPAEQDVFTPPQFKVDEKTHERQQIPRTHQTYVLPDGDVLAPDFGSDKVWRLSHKEGEGWTEKQGIDFEQAQGPRHSLLHPDGKHLFTLTELGNEIQVHDLTNPSAPPVYRHSILPPGDKDHASLLTASELILLDPLTSDGPMLLITSNRDSPNAEADALTLFTVSPTDGSKVQPAEQKHVFAGGKHLRGVAADASGKFVAVTSRNTNELYIYEREGDGTRLKEVARAGGMERIICPLWVRK